MKFKLNLKETTPLAGANIQPNYDIRNVFTVS